MEGCRNLSGQAADERAAHQPCQCFDDEIPGVVFGAAGGPFLRGNMANERRVLRGKQLETRRAVREPAYVFGGAAHQAVGFADEAAMEAAAKRLEKTEHQKLRRSGFEKRQTASLEQITDKKSG